MSTLNVSMPESMRKYIEEQAAEGEFTTSEYVRHLVRMDQERKTQERRAQMAQYLALCEQQIARGEIVTQDMDEMLAEFQAEYKARRKKRSKK